jgi:hypothetical protein
MTTNTKKGIGTLGMTRNELIDHFEKYISPETFERFLTYDDTAERQKIEDQIGKQTDEQWEKDRNFTLEDAWYQVINEDN